ncbi:response regulator [Leptolyngbya sp. FACHB-261]|uniref:response regulator n=1 Tax=Leptolyngbya sp. FACHB-261 TaxID=2692806 RepID=UPI0016889CC8|nr:response regulator [Leptolyngbya sp. FACHB-261]MBD2100626.1 response regulator [Leptolyngbya sp. FACHB-261]
MTTAERNATDTFVQKLVDLKQKRFSGQLSLRDPLGHEWTLYLCLGRISYATGGTHPVRRWQRNLTAHCPEMDPRQPKLLSEFSEASSTAPEVYWEYQVLCTWLGQQRIARAQVVAMIRAIVAEVLLDITRAAQVTCEVKRDNALPTQIVLIDIEQALLEAEQAWQAWRAAKVADRSPNRAPVIKQPEQLQQQTSPTVYRVLKTLLDGQHTLRDISVQMKRDVVEVIRSLLPYIQAGLVELTNIPDLPAPISPPTSSPLPTPSPSGPLIACVDDSPVICQAMEGILTTAGYRFVAIQDSLRAIATLLARKPDLIFLDLVMPNTNGYEICGSLRKLSSFNNVPIVILTGNDGIVDRVRAKVVGSSDFLGKPPEVEAVLEVTRRHLAKSQYKKTFGSGH